MPPECKLGMVERLASSTGVGGLYPEIQPWQGPVALSGWYRSACRQRLSPEVSWVHRLGKGTFYQPVSCRPAAVSRCVYMCWGDGTLGVASFAPSLAILSLPLDPPGLGGVMLWCPHSWLSALLLWGTGRERLPEAFSMPLCVSLGLDSDCPALLGSSGGCGSVFPAVQWCVCFSPPPHISGLKALVLS